MIKEKKIAIILMVVIAACLIVFVRAEKGDSIAGEYIGTSGSYLNLKKDGTCIYSENDSTGTGTGEWSYKDNRVEIKVSNIGYQLYANLEGDSDGFLLQGSSSSWNDEYFSKQ